MAAKSNKNVKKPAKKSVKPTKKVNKKAVKSKPKKITPKVVDPTKAFARGDMGVTVFPGGLAAFVHRAQQTPPPVPQPVPVAEQPKAPEPEVEQPILSSNVDTNPPPKAEQPKTDSYSGRAFGYGVGSFGSKGVSDQPHPMMEGMPPEILSLMEQAQRMGGTGIVILDMGTRKETPEEIEDSLLRQVAKMVDGIYGSNISKRVNDLITAVRKG